MTKVCSFRKVSTSELENIICEIGGVISSCVVGIFDDSTGNDLIFGFAVKDPRYVDLTEDHILDYVNGKVIDAKKLRGEVHFLDALPLTFSGKVQKSAVKKIAQEFLDCAK